MRTIYPAAIVPILYVLCGCSSSSTTNVEGVGGGSVGGSTSTGKPQGGGGRSGTATTTASIGGSNAFGGSGSHLASTTANAAGKSSQGGAGNGEGGAVTAVSSTDTGGKTAALSGLGGNQPASGGTSSIGPITTGGSVPAGGAANGGATLSTIGSNALGGGSSGAAPGTGGAKPTGGAPATGSANPLGGALATGGANPIGGAPATGGAKPTGGAPATGGANPTGGAPATGGACTSSTPTIGAIGSCCTQNGAYGCAAHAGPHKVLCVNGVWSNNGDCDNGQYCDTRTGGTAGSCVNIVPECSGKNPGDTVCNPGATAVETCGADLVTATTTKTCTGTTPACLGAACVACSPNAKRCDPAGSNGLQTCGDNGTWGTPLPCSGGTPICNAATNSCVACPAAGGQTMVAVPLNFCIDSTEVTIAQYKTWLDKLNNLRIGQQENVCAWNDDFAPTMDWPPTDATSSKPVSYVDWCDAYAYCKDMGKHLCGKIGGGSNAFNDYTDYTKSQWFAACTSNGAYAPSGYPYGNTYSPSACNTRDYWGSGVGTLMFVKEFILCQSSLPGYVGVYDLSGNVQEWEDSCDGATGASDTCRQRGGSFWARAAEGFIGSQCSAQGMNPRSVKQDDSGFRCCAF